MNIDLNNVEFEHKAIVFQRDKSIAFKIEVISIILNTIKGKSNSISLDYVEVIPSNIVVNLSNVDTFVFITDSILWIN